MPDDSSKRTYVVHETDVLMAGNFTISAFGPIDHGGVDGVRSALRTAMSAGPSARLGLIPSSTSRRWEYAPERILDAVREIPPITPADYDAAMARELREVRAPVSISLAGDYAVVYIDHGVGDGQMTLNLSQTLTSTSARGGEVPSWTAATVERNPLLRAAIGWYGQNPRRLLALISGSDSSIRTGADAPTQPWTPAISSASAQSTDSYPNELQAWRKKNRPQVSLSSLFFAAVVRALRAEGVEIDNTVKVLFNVRRYLDPSRSSLANLSAGLELPLRDAGSADDVNDAIRRATDSGRPIANLTAASIKSKIARRRANTSTTVDSAESSGPVGLTLTDMGPIDRTHTIEWHTPDNRSYAAMVTPESPRRITIAVGRVPAFNATASFHDNIVDRDAVTRALERACTRAIELLEEPELR